MDLKRYDWTRRNANPVELDLIEHYAARKISRRNFIKRGSMIGLSAGMMSTVIAACGDDDGGGGDTSGTGGGGGGGGQGGALTVAVQAGDATSGLDPLNMLDLGTYGVVSQSFDYLVGLADDDGIGPTALATGWEPNEDGTVWTFNLREGVLWQDGTPFTAADVVATLDRMILAGAGVSGVYSEGAGEAVDDLTVRVTLDKPNGNFPVLVSVYNANSLITPADYSDGTTLDARPAGTGAWVLDSFDAATATSIYSPNPNWWGGSVNLESLTVKGFESVGTAVAALQSNEIDMVQQFPVIEGASLLSDDSLTILRPQAANHRQLWFNTQLPEGGPFTDPRVRKAVSLCLNRQQMVDVLYQGEGLVANDHPVHPSMPMYDADAVEQAPRDIEMARQLLSDAGYPDGLDATIQVGDLQEIPDMAAIVEQNCAEAGIRLSVNTTPNSDFYGEYWCTGASWGSQPETGGPGRPCGASAEIGIVDYGHRPTPDVYFGRALETDGDWNSSNYASSEFDRLFGEYQSSVDVEGQTTAVSSIMGLLQEDLPASYPVFYQYLSAHKDNISGVKVSALGHMKFENATKA